MSETKIRILFVDGDEFSRVAVSAYLGGYGYGVTTAGSPAEGLLLARREEFDLLLLGDGPADGAGGELCRKIREFDRSTPVVFYCDGSPDSRREAPPHGAQAHVLKPDLSALGTKLEETLRAAFVR